MRLSIFLGLNLLCLQAFAVPASEDINLDSVLNSRIVFAYSLGDSEFGDLCYQLRIPCGEERSALKQTQHGVLQTIKDQSVREILDGIVKKNPGYRWEVVDGVLLMESPGPGSKALQKQIGAFEVVSQRLVPAVMELSYTLKIPGEHTSVGASSFLAGGHTAEDEQKVISARFSNSSIRHILCALVAAHGHAMWSFIRRDPWKPWRKDILSVWVY
jgi:hypothetical protein